MTAPNWISIKEETGVTTTNYPVQIGRIFSIGEISNYPQIVISGSSITTQADVKSRWVDNSVKHAILTFYIPTLSANNTVVCTFQNQTSGNNTGYLTKTQMLSAAYNFDANIVLTSGTSISASARAMVNADKFSYWTSGSISTSIIVVDHTSARSYDMGFDPYLSFRPIFHVTFWPLIGKVKVRYIGELANSEKLQDIGYSLQLMSGNTSTSAVYTKSAFLHPVMTRWTKSYWIGNSLGEISHNHNLAYLAESKGFFNWDTTKTISQSQITSDYSAWLASSKDLYDGGLWDLNQFDTGSRPEIAPCPGWYVRWFYTGDIREERIAMGMSELACAWPIHLRECNPTKNIQGSNSGLGKVISLRNRPTFCSTDLSYQYTSVSDKVTFVSATAANSWQPDMAHMPDTNGLIYLVTGDFYHLEELYFWSAWAAASPNGQSVTQSYGRGPTGAEGAIPEAVQLRGNAWSFRNRVHAAFLSPDDFVEKTYFTTLIDDAIAGWEGYLSISGTSYTGNAVYNWALAHYLNTPSAPPLYQWGKGRTLYADPSYGIDDTVTYEAISGFEQHFILVSLGRAKELGYATSALVDHLSNFYIGAITDSGYNPYLLDLGRLPTTKVSDQSYFTTWSSLKSGFLAANQSTSAYRLTDLDGAYAILAMAATSFASGPGSQEAWDFMNSKVLSGSALNERPTWALSPRGPLTSFTASNPVTNHSLRNHKTISILFG